jgi:hypothetical protein
VMDAPVRPRVVLDKDQEMFEMNEKGIHGLTRPM